MTSISPAAVLRQGLHFLAPVSVALTIYLYLWPLFHSCAFPLPLANGVDTGDAAFRATAATHWPLNAMSNGADLPTRSAPFRLLALGDPQLEGDTSIPYAHGHQFPHFWSLLSHMSFTSKQPSLRHRVRQVLHNMVDMYLDDPFMAAEAIRKRIDLFGNDLFLAHIYRTLHWWTRPTHVSVLGDLVGSQWLDDAEFLRRSHRFWKRVFRGGERVPDDVARAPAPDYDLAGFLGAEDADSEAWKRRIINVAGNHDIGYAGDINKDRIDRFESAFGKTNYELRFELGDNSSTSGDEFLGGLDHATDRLVPELRIIVLNSMNLDTPAQSKELQDATYDFINSVINTASAVEYSGQFTLVLTHVPLYKPSGICVDDPFFDFHDKDGSLKEQNQLSADASRGFLEGIFGMNPDPNGPGRGTGRPGVILNGHDHEGCDTWHFVDQTQGESPQDRKWQTQTWRDALVNRMPGKPQNPGIREITVRSMMGDFGGNAGLLSVWFDQDEWQWKFEYATCPLGTQHLWWTVHVLDFITILFAITYGVLSVLSACGIDIRIPLPTSTRPVPTRPVEAEVKKEETASTNGEAKAGPSPISSSK
jgi:hypothetical protein